MSGANQTLDHIGQDFRGGEVRIECSFQKAMFGEIIIQIHLLHLPLPYLVKYIMLLSLTWELKVTVHDLLTLNPIHMLNKKLESTLYDPSHQSCKSLYVKWNRGQEGRSHEKLLVYRPAWCRDGEITYSGIAVLDKTSVFSILSYPSLSI